jgi:hypothetical protein
MIKSLLILQEFRSWFNVGEEREPFPEEKSLRDVAESDDAGQQVLLMGCLDSSAISFMP